MRFLGAPCVALAGLLVTALGHAEGTTTPAPATPTAASPATATPSAATPADAKSTPLPAGSDAAPDGPVVVPGDSDEVRFEPIPSAQDMLGGHLLLGGAVGAKWGFGALNDHQSQRSELGPALALNLDLGVGVSRTVVVGLWGEFDDYSAPSRCSICSGKSFAGGPFLGYHVAQGTRFDPWIQLAFGVRHTTIDNGGRSDEHFNGFEIWRVSTGADYYVTSGVALGPYFEIDQGTYGAFHWDTLHTDLGAGLRLSINLPGR